MIETKAYLNLLEQSFPGIKGNVARCETVGFTWESKQFLKEKNGEVISHVGLLDYPLLMDGKLQSACALHAICTKDTERCQGLASELIQEALEWASNAYEFVILFTEIPKFYEKMSFQCIQEYRFHLVKDFPKGSKPLRPITSPKDDVLFIRTFQERAPVSNNLWMKDHGFIASFNALFASHPVYWSLYYCPAIDGFISYSLKDRTLHLYDIIASKIPSLDLILDHLPNEIDEIYLYFSPDLVTDEAVHEPYLYGNSRLMAYGALPEVKPFMISPLSRC